MAKAYQLEGQMSIFDLLAPQTEKEYKPGEWVDKSELGKEITFDEIANMIGELIILDKSIVSHEWFKVVQVEQIVMNEGQRRLVYYDGGHQRGLINEMYFNLEDKVNGCAKYRQHAYMLKKQDEEINEVQIEKKYIQEEAEWTIFKQNGKQKFPPYTTQWIDLECKVYYKKQDKTYTELVKYKDYTFITEPEDTHGNGEIGEIIAWRVKDGVQ